MAADDKKTKWKRWRDCIAEYWQRCLDLALVLWIVRVPVCAVIVGWLILDYTPQAQDLFTEFADSSVRIAIFLLLLATVWAGTTHMQPGCCSTPTRGFVPTPTRAFGRTSAALKR